ncbi:ribonuclease [Clostridium hydrogenum]|uniref:ribonuclease n=1 Tax=Clostridium hydrogenum TaxID=2855764 RepID=UPI001F227E5A|nr:ribonuclease [Clostridium hydrogenum]
MKKRLTSFLICMSLIISFLGIIPGNLVNAKSVAITLNRHSYSKSTAITTFQGVADYIHKYGVLPSNFITKEQAEDLGWEPGENLWAYAYGKSIGGDIFTNSEGSLPDAEGRVWHECDINYHGGHRGADRLVYSNDGLIYGTSDHYETFTQYY